MPNGHYGDHPLTDLLTHGTNHFPDDMKEAILKLKSLDSSGEHTEMWQTLWRDSWYWSWYTGWDKPIRRFRGRRWLKQQIARLEAKE
jgi:hypothetical protein